MKLKYYILGMTLILSAACSKKTADTPIATVPERLEVTPDNESVAIGGSAAFSVIYFNTLGAEAPAPAGITWSSNNALIATVDQQGNATGISAGQAEIKAAYKNVSAKALFTVVASSTQVAIVEIIPPLKELKLNEVFSLTATAKDINGNLISGKAVTWETDNALNATINTTPGQVTAKAYGTANISATADGIKSSPAMVQVIRIGNFMDMSSTGTAKLKIENGILKLQTSTDFFVSSGPPDLRIYLGNTNNSIDGAVEIASLTTRSGAQSWNMPAGLNITDYRYVIVWCKQFGGTYGVADLGN